MGLTPYPRAASLSQVLRFPRRNSGDAETRTASLRRFELSVGVAERVLDTFAGLAGVVLATFCVSRAVWPIETLAVAGLVIGALMVGLLEIHGYYRPCLSLLAVRETERLLRATVSCSLIALPALEFMTKAFRPRTVTAGAICVSLCLAVERWCSHYWIQGLRRRWGLTRKAVIVGTGPLARRIFSALAYSPKLGIDPVAFVAETECVEQPVIYDSWYQHRYGAKVIDGPATANMLRRLKADLVILADPQLSRDRSMSIGKDAESCGAGSYSTSEIFDCQDTETEYVELDGLLLAHRSRGSERRLYQVAKRGIDVSLSLLLLVVLSPLLAAAAVAVRMTSAGPAIFRQKRIGQNGRPFEIYKFRSMYVDCATYARSPLNRQDTRITPMGRILRHTCIDELPQLVNVLRGEMSLVGPRPEMPFIVDQYQALHLSRLVAKPGITGLWQLSADRMSPIHENISYDLYWIEDCVEGLMRLMASNYQAPLNLGTEELVTVDQLVDMTCEIAGKRLRKVHALDKPQGVRGRNSDNSRLRRILGWEPTTPLAQGLALTYRWIEGELERSGRLIPELAYA
jgi:lipopolysaccharide/colanic/teichoic acid biosynthesis glycosyltransferase